MTFRIDPYVGAGPFRFGMSESEVLAQGLVPRNRRLNRRGEVDLRFGDFSMRLGADDGRLCEIEFDRMCQVTLADISVFGDQNVLDQIVSLDNQSYEYAGVLVFFGLGLSLSGFHDQNETGKCLSAFCRGYWDAKLGSPKFKPWRRSDPAI